MQPTNRSIMSFRQLYISKLFEVGTFWSRATLQRSLSEDQGCLADFGARELQTRRDKSYYLSRFTILNGLAHQSSHSRARL